MVSIRANRRVLLALGAVAALAFTAVGCGDDDDDAATEGGDTTAEERGTLTVCSDIPYPPFEFEGDDGEYTGFDIELLREVADRMNRDLEVTVQTFDGIWLQPEAGTCDIVASAMTITPERQEEALFSDPYFEADQSLLVLAENEDDYATLEDLEGQTVGVQTGTTGEEYANENKPEGATIRDYDDATALFLALTSNEIQAVLQDWPVNANRATEDDSFVVTETYQTNEEYGFAVAQDNQELIDEVNATLAEMREDGTYDEIFEEWFGEASS